MTDAEQLASIRDILRPVLGTETCPRFVKGDPGNLCDFCHSSECSRVDAFAPVVHHVRKSYYCEKCLPRDWQSQTGTRAVVDGLSVEDAVRRMADWYTALDDALVVHWCWKPGHDTDPRKALNDLICAQMSIALDPAVSEEAAKLRDTYLDAIAEMRERAAKEADLRGGTTQGDDYDRGWTRCALRVAEAIRALPISPRNKEPKR